MSTTYENILNKYIISPGPQPAKSPVADPDPSASISAAPISASVTSSGTSTNPQQVIPTMEQHSPLFSKGGGALETMYRTLHKDQEPESAEEAAAREKREQRNSTLMALSDGLAGIANIWGAAKGATPADLSSMSEPNRMRYEYAKRERERNTDAWRKGVFNSRMQDIQNRQANEQAHLKAQRDKEEREYKRSRDKIADTYKDKDLAFKQAEAERKAEMEAQKFEEQKRKNQADEKIRLRTVALAEKQSSSRGPNTGATIKTVMFALSDGKSIHVPEDLKYDYYADVYDVLSRVAEKKGDNTIIDFMKQSQGIGITKSSVMRDAVHLYAKKHSEVEKYMIKRAEEYMNNYDSLPVAKGQSAPGAPGIANVPIDMKALAPNWGSQTINSKIPVATEDELLEYLIE